ncbi:MAG: hypothetical protein ABEJ93_00580 [Candidatus Nanohalobium sp.]
MVLSLFIDGVVGVVSGSWFVSSVLVKYFLLFEFSRFLFGEEVFSLKAFVETVEKDSEVFVSVVLVLGGLAALSGFSFSPFLVLVSEASALLFYGFLFWRV